jgi:hypothetical protein
MYGFCVKSSPASCTEHRKTGTEGFMANDAHTRKSHKDSKYSWNVIIILKKTMILADLDPFLHFNAYAELDPRQSDANMRPLVYRPSTAPFMSLHATILSVHGSPWPHF